MTVLRGATWWEFFLQTSRSFLDQNYTDQSAGKPTFQGLKISGSNFTMLYYFLVFFAMCVVCFAMFCYAFLGFSIGMSPKPGRLGCSGQEVGPLECFGLFTLGDRWPLPWSERLDADEDREGPYR